MSIERFDDVCRGCSPALLDIKTGRPYPDSSPEMQLVDRLWGETTPEERRAWHRVTCQNSRAVLDLALAKGFADRIEAAFAAARGRK